MAIIEKKLSWTVKSKMEEGGQVTVNLVATTPEGVTFASPSEGIFLVMQKDQCTLEVDQIIEGIVVAQYDDTIL